ncbi:MAG TPA: DUF202 domain-containing protein [Longimicrobium sp.]|jgi:putative membrane protein
MSDTLSLSDRLALERTVLANERTVLAYVRTALALAGGGAGLAGFFPGPLAGMVGWSLVAIGLVALATGVYRFIRVGRRLRARAS